MSYVGLYVRRTEHGIHIQHVTVILGKLGMVVMAVQDLSVVQGIGKRKANLEAAMEEIVKLKEMEEIAEIRATEEIAEVKEMEEIAEIKQQERYTIP